MAKHGKKILSIFLAFGMVFGLIGGTGLIANAAESSDQSWDDGDSSGTDFTISTADESASYAVSFELTNLTAGAGETDSTDGTSDYSVTLSVTNSVVYSLPDAVTVTVGGTVLDTDAYSYDSSTGVVTVYAGSITGDIVIAATAVANYAASVTSTSGTGYYESVADAFSYANSLSTAEITVLKDCQVNGALTVSGAAVTLNLAGYTLTIIPSSAAALTVNGGMTLEDSSESGTGTLTNGMTSGNASGGAVVVGGAGTLTINGGAISGSYAGTLGAGVYVDGGVLIMNGGAIMDNYAGSYGSGVYVLEGDFTMNGGEISGNICRTYGAGVYLKSSAFVMNGGTISGNSLESTTNSTGGGIYADSSSSLTMNDGEISENEAAYAGSGIFLSSASLTMNGGSIKNNSVLSGGKGNYGIGLYVGGNTFTMSGGEITGNTSANSATLGAGVYATASASTTISGKVVISGNTADGAASNYYMVSTNKKITLADGLADGSSIGVTTSTAPTTSASVQITTKETSTSYYASAKQYFSSDAGYEVHVNDSGYLELYIEPSTYNVTWNLTNLNTTGANSAIDSSNYTAVLSSAADGYEIPEEITVTVGGTQLDDSVYSYDLMTGEFSLSSGYITGDIVITASAAAIPEAPAQDENGNYQLYTENDVLWIQSRVQRGMQNISAVMMEDIAMSDTFTGIGSADAPFVGTLDGDNHTITLNISSAATAGLFAYADGATVKNLVTAGSVTSTAGSGTGSVAGYVGSNGITIENCVNQASVTGYQKTGGFVGTMATTGIAVIAGCSNEGAVTGSSTYTGGVIGYVNAAAVSESMNSGSVSGTTYVGGIIGYTSTNTTAGQGTTVSDCLNTGTVAGTGHTGGIIGWAKGASASYPVTLSRCGNEGDISVSTLTGYTGGIVGYFNNQYASGDSLYNTGTVSGTRYLGGIAGRDSGAPLTNVYNIGAVTSDTTNANCAAGGIIGYCGTAGTALTNAYNAGAVTANEGATSVGLIVGYATTSYYLLVDHVYYLNTLEVPSTNTYGDSVLYSSETTEVMTDEEKAAMAKSADELMLLASTLGDAFKDNSNSEYHSGYPVLTWEENEEAEELQITSQPADVTGTAGSTAVFELEAAGSNLTYQWQYLNAGAENWKNSGMSGSDTAALSVSITEARDGQQYRCIVTDGEGNTVTSDAAILTVSTESGFSITLQPSDYTGLMGSTAVFTVEADGTGLSYRWQYKSADGTMWHDSGMSGSDTATLSVPVTEARDGQQYRCIVTDENGNSLISEAATLSLPSAGSIVITAQPADVGGSVGDTATFTVEATGTDLTYQWQYLNAGAVNWKNSGMTGSDTAVLSVLITEARDGQQYRCVISDADGSVVVSDVVTISVE